MNFIKTVNRGDSFILEDKQVINFRSQSVLTKWVYESVIFAIDLDLHTYEKAVERSINYATYSNQYC
jgi:uncharacterized membrane protein